VWFRARPKLQVNRHMGNLVNVGHQEEKRMKIAIEGDLQRARMEKALKPAKIKKALVT